MSEPSHPHRLTHGVVWNELAVGSAAGFALADWSYLRPTDDRPIPREEFRFATWEEKREVVRFWFLLNLRPYSLTGGPWFAFDSQYAGFGQTAFAPPPVLAIEAIDREFGALLGPELGTDIADEFPGEWMWGPPPPKLLAEPQHQARGADVQKEILARLDVLAAELRKLVSVETGHARVGHNSGVEVPFTKEDRQGALEFVARSREAAVRQDWPGLVQAALPLRLLANKLGVWLYRKFDLMTDEFAKKPWTVPLTLAALKFVQEVHSLEQLTKLAALLK